MGIAFSRLMAAAILCGATCASHATASTGERRFSSTAICMSCETPETPVEGAPPLLLDARLVPEEGALKFSLTNGLTVVLDLHLNKVFIGDRSGTMETTLDNALLDAAQGNQALAQSYRARLAVALSDEFNTLQLSKIMEGAGAFASEKIGPSLSHRRLDELRIGDGFAPFDCQFDIYCNYKPWQVDGGTLGSHWYSFGYVQPYDPIGGGGDYQAWKVRRDAACESAQRAAAVGMATGAALGPTCASIISTGPAGAVGCVADAVLFGLSTAWMLQDMKICKSEYPGPGAW